VTIREEAQKGATDAKVVLFILDVTPLGGQLHYLTASVLPDGPIVFGGNSYMPVPIEADGFEWTTQGALPRPKLRMGDINGVAQSLLVQYGDLQGAVVTRLRTFRKYLDDGTDPDPDATMSPDIYVISRKSQHIPGRHVEWELAAKLDQQGKVVPARTAVRNACSWVYRTWDEETEAFVYTHATCPYAGTSYFLRNGQPTTDPALDRCGKLLVHCRARFGTQPLPFGAFPSLAKVRG